MCPSVKSIKIPLWGVFTLDFTAFAALFGVFMLVHYVGGQLGGETIPGIGDAPPVSVFTKAPSTGYRPDPSAPATVDPSADLGQFGASFPHRFLGEGEATVLCSEDDEVRDYLTSKGYSFYDADGEGEFVGLYQSSDVFVSVLRVDTVMNSLASGNPHDERYFVYDIYIKNIENLYTYATSSRKSLEELVDEAGSELDFTVDIPIAAVNGDYFGNTNHCLIAERNGALLGTPNLDYILSDLCVLYYDGRMESYTPKTFDWSKIAAGNPYQIWNFGPGLMDGNGKSLGSYSNDSYDHNVVGDRHPRTIFGYYQPGHYCFVSIDGRSDYSDGMTLPEVGLLMEKIGCMQAYNMDGGDSAYAYYDGAIIRQNENRYQVGNDRKIYDIICVGEIRREHEDDSTGGGTE